MTVAGTWRHELTEAQQWRQPWHRRWTDAAQTDPDHASRWRRWSSWSLSPTTTRSTTLLQNAGQETPLAYVSLVPAIALALAAIRARPLQARAADPRPPGRLHRRAPADRGRHGGQPAACRPGCRRCSGSTGSTCSPFRSSWPARWPSSSASGSCGARSWPSLYLFLAWPYPYQSVLLARARRLHRRHLVGHRADPARRPGGQAGVVASTTRCSSSTHHGQHLPAQHRLGVLGREQRGGLPAGRVGLRRHRAGSHRPQGALAARRHGCCCGPSTWAGSPSSSGRGRTWGEHVAINILHPFIGLVTFSIGVADHGPADQARWACTSASVSAPDRLRAVPVPDSAPPMRTPRVVLAVPKVYLALIMVVMVAALVLGISNFGPADLQPGGRRVGRAATDGLHPAAGGAGRVERSLIGGPTTGPSRCSGTPRCGTAT